ncbi:hypothetical protein JG687_00012068 [Phytophthora cactorum]|uniref:Uncharacterized protein n=1 Tax=Phytophthora cactorum TaxID=29920 RepID=A0A8T1U5C0_9STRA|nr:hypothetical protein JG687_00012068 [Phytophthora cactorum]
MALVNGYITHKCKATKQLKKAYSHYEYMATLHEPLISQTAREFTTSIARETGSLIQRGRIIAGDDHDVVQSKDTRVNIGVERARQRQWKVCSIFKPANKKRDERRRFTVRGARKISVDLSRYVTR